MVEPSNFYLAFWSLPLKKNLFFAQRENSHEGFLRNFDAADHLHALLALFLLLQQFAFARDIAAITFGKHVFTHGFDGFAGDDARANSGLDGHFKELARNELAQALG